MTPLESAQAIVEKWYSQENGKAYLMELISAELERRDEAVKVLFDGLDEIANSGWGHDSEDEIKAHAIEALEQYRKQNKGEMSWNTI